MIELADVADTAAAIRSCQTCAREACDCPVVVAEMAERVEALRQRNASP